MSVNAKDRITPRFCGNCGALMLGKECTDCAPYERIMHDCEQQMLMLQSRYRDAAHSLAIVRGKRRKAVAEAVLLN